MVQTVTFMFDIVADASDPTQTYMKVVKHFSKRGPWLLLAPASAQLHPSFRLAAWKPKSNTCSIHLIVLGARALVWNNSSVLRQYLTTA